MDRMSCRIDFSSASV